MWLDLWKPSLMAQELKSSLMLNIKATPCQLSRHTTHRAIDGQVCFHRQSFADPVRWRRFTTVLVGPLKGTNWAIWGVKLLPTTVCAYTMPILVGSVLYWRHNTAICLFVDGITRLRLSHPPPIQFIWDIAGVVKKLSKKPALLAKGLN